MSEIIMPYNGQVPASDNTMWVEQMNEGFVKYHINERGQHPLPIRPVLHHFTKATDEDFHNHPHGFTSYVAHGSYVEEVPVRIDGQGKVVCRKIHRKKGDIFNVSANYIHRITDLPEGDCVTFVIPGPDEQKSGFFRFTDAGILYRQWDEPDFKPYNQKQQ